MSQATSNSLIIGANIDLYGSKARSSALADYVELSALHGLPLTRAHVSDLVADNGWEQKPIRQFYTGMGDEDPASWGDSIFSLLGDRKIALGDLYPFEFYRNRLRLKAGSDPLSNRYVSLLCLTLAHHWSVNTGHDVAAVMESIVVDVLTNLGISAIGIGVTDRREGCGFVEALAEAGEFLGLSPMEDPTPRSRRAKDAGVDTVAGAIWKDGRRAGQWLFAGQVTVGRSETWKDKAKEPNGAVWAKFLNEPIPMQAFLAVPHHVEDEHLIDLLTENRLIIDRLRIVAKKKENNPAEIDIIKAVQSCSIE